MDAVAHCSIQYTLEKAHQQTEQPLPIVAPLVGESFALLPEGAVQLSILVFRDTSWIWWLRATMNQHLWAPILWEGTAHLIIQINVEIQNVSVIGELEARCHTEIRIRLRTTAIYLITLRVRNINNQCLRPCAFTFFGSLGCLRLCTFTSFRRSRYDDVAIRHVINLFGYGL